MRNVFCFILILWSLQVSAQTFVQSKSSAQGATPQSVTLTSSVTAGDTLIVIIASSSLGTSGALTATDGNSNSYACGSVLHDATNTSMKLAFCCLHAPNLSTNPPVISGADADGSNHLEVNAREYSSSLTCTTDGQSASTSSSTTAATTSNLTTTATDLLVVGFLDTSHNWSAGAGWTNSNIDNGAVAFLFEDKVSQAAGTYSGAGTLSLADAAWSGAIAAFKVSAGGSTGGGLGGQSGAGGKAGVGV